MALEAEFAESRVEEVAPLAKVALVEVEDDRDVVENAEGLDLRRGRRHDVGAIVGVRMDGRGSHGRGRRSEGIG